MTSNAHRHSKPINTAASACIGNGLLKVSDFSHLPVGQHVQHDLCAHFEREAKSLAIRQHIDLSLSGHVVLKQFFLPFCKAIGQCITGFDNFIQSFCILTVSLKAAITGADITEVKVFEY